MKRLVSSFIAFAAFGALTLGAAHAEKWGVDGAHAYAHFSIIHFGIAPNYGRFDTIGGSYDVEGGELKGLTIDPSIFNADDKEVVEDLILAAIKDVQAKAAERTKYEMGNLAESMGLPRDMNLPGL